MRAFRLVLAALLCYFSSHEGVCAVLAHNAAPQLAGRTEAQVRGQFVAVLLSQVGVREDLVRGQYRNSGRQVKAYLHAIGLPEGYAWCSALLVWACHEVGLRVRANGLASSWFTPATKRWPGVPGAGDPEPGDPVAFRFGRRAGIDHVAANIFWGTGPTADTVQGNTSGSRATGEGQGVYRKWVLKSQIYQVADLFKCLK